MFQANTNKDGKTSFCSRAISLFFVLLLIKCIKFHNYLATILHFIFITIFLYKLFPGFSFCMLSTTHFDIRIYKNKYQNLIVRRRWQSSVLKHFALVVERSLAVQSVSLKRKGERRVSRIISCKTNLVAGKISTLRIPMKPVGHAVLCAAISMKSHTLQSRSRV